MPPRPASPPGPPREPPPFAVPCPCGATLRGHRLAVAQVLPCPGCGRDVFVLPRCPYPPPGPAHPPTSPTPPPRPPGRAVTWLLTGVAALLLTAVAAGTVTLLATWPAAPSRPASPAAAQLAPAAESWQAHLSRARGHVRLGHFRLALGELDAALAGVGAGGCDTPGHAALAHRRAEAALFADLLAEPLEDLVAHAAALPGGEWRAESELRYRGRSVVLDTTLAPAGEDDWQVGYAAHVGDEAVTLSLRGVDALRPLPRDGPRRVVLGLRLDGVARARPGQWVVRFAPDGGVLCADPEALAACCPALGDAATAEVLRSQRALQSLPDGAGCVTVAP